MMIEENKGLNSFPWEKKSYKSTGRRQFHSGQVLPSSQDLLQQRGLISVRFFLSFDFVDECTEKSLVFILPMVKFNRIRIYWHNFRSKSFDFIVFMGRLLLYFNIEVFCLRSKAIDLKILEFVIGIVR
ncbi:hypothetical protein RHGRI_006219 [Rhododendron griersonianum]|uniref:Uncharacterized protein n=1 Tax=Rhododendron griersonianum TaxID=479676 RepID=A0AAV6KS93_9ERIC|nr:hypothetical protein RHGRI_006219 [Rhododendron griersonianum]